VIRLRVHSVSRRSRFALVIGNVSHLEGAVAPDAAIMPIFRVSSTITTKPRAIQPTEPRAENRSISASDFRVPCPLAPPDTEFRQTYGIRHAEQRAEKRMSFRYPSRSHLWVV
jgi:hypothetical protein